ncbi:hypothetical protein DFH09DRAFT_1394090 [Mycena vulgaris]|nr:hypothetical protein DFH09DRAFT_1394090 [Mycena vulgaris]
MGWAPHRVALYSALSSRLDVNILALDYRGFGDSAGHPTHDGVAADARAGWDYLIAQGAAPDDVLILSLGPGIAALLAVEFSREDIAPRGFVLLAASTSLQTLMYEYYLFGVLPLLKPLAMVPTLSRMLMSLVLAYLTSMTHRLCHLDAVASLRRLELGPEDDWDIAHAHADALFAVFLDPLLPPLATLPTVLMHFSAGDWADFATKQTIRAELRADLVTATHIPALGILETAGQEGPARAA